GLAALAGVAGVAGAFTSHRLREPPAGLRVDHAFPGRWSAANSCRPPDERCAARCVAPTGVAAALDGGRHRDLRTRRRRAARLVAGAAPGNQPTERAQPPGAQSPGILLLLS